jgi:hypothetical protein
MRRFPTSRPRRRRRGLRLPASFTLRELSPQFRDSCQDLRPALSLAIRGINFRPPHGDPREDSQPHAADRTLSFVRANSSYGSGGTTLTLTVRTAVPVELATCFRSDSVRYRRRDAQTAPTTPMVSRPCSRPALTTAWASRVGRAARTCSTTNDRSNERVFNADSLFPVRDNKSLRLLGFCIAAGILRSDRHGKTVRKSLF